MSRKPRNFQANYTYHITTRCNNREFNLRRGWCREVIIYTLQKALKKYDLVIYGLCIMSNHVHYMMASEKPQEWPNIMHFINWYTAMCFNRMLNRTGHFWEQRYYSTGFSTEDFQRALNTLRYIHANPKTANMRSSFFYEFSNYGTYAQLTDDGLTQWHPGFLALSNSLDECAKKYRQFCQRYQATAKPNRNSAWGNKLLAGVKQEKPPIAQHSLPCLENAQEDPSEIAEIAKHFVAANRFAPSHFL